MQLDGGQVVAILLVVVCCLVGWCGLGWRTVGLSQLCSVFDQLCYSIMLHFLINYASKCTNYASYMTNYSHIKIVNFIRFSLKMQCKTRRKILQVISSS